MQRLDEQKRRQIMDAAVALFSARPFHEVKLDDVAAGAKVGKGTLYVYFSSKEDLYLSLVREGFSELESEMRRAIAVTPGEGAWPRLRVVIAGLIRFGTRYPDLFRVMRNRTLTPDDPELQRTRAAMTGLVTGLIREGVAAGELDDPCPEITARLILGLARSVLLYPPEDLSPEIMERHMVRVLRRGICKRCCKEGAA